MYGNGNHKREPSGSTSEHFPSKIDIVPQGIALRHQIPVTGALYWDHGWILLTCPLLLLSGAFDGQP